MLKKIAMCQKQRNTKWHFNILWKTVRAGVKLFYVNRGTDMAEPVALEHTEHLLFLYWSYMLYWCAYCWLINDRVLTFNYLSLVGKKNTVRYNTNFSAFLQSVYFYSALFLQQTRFISVHNIYLVQVKVKATRYRAIHIFA